MEKSHLARCLLEGEYVFHLEFSMESLKRQVDAFEQFSLDMKDLTEQTEKEEFYIFLNEKIKEFKTRRGMV